MFLKISKSLILVLTIIFSSSCKPTGIEEPAPLKVVITKQSAVDVAVGNAPAVVVVNSDDFTTAVQEFSVQYSDDRVRVERADQIVVAGQTYSSYAKNGVQLSITALALGEHSIVVTMREQDKSGTVTIKVNGKDKIYTMELINEPRPRPCGKRELYDFKIIDPQNPGAQNANYRVWAKVVKGKGVVQMMSNEVLWNDTIPNYEPQSCIVANETWGGMYTGFEIGENIVEFTIEDKQQRRVTSLQSFTIDSSDFTIKRFSGAVGPKADTIEHWENGAGFQIDIDPLGEYDTKFSLAFEWGSYAQNMPGELHLENSSVVQGQWTPYIRRGTVTHTLSFLLSPPATSRWSGDVYATILVKDLWGKIKRLPVHIYAKPNNTWVVNSTISAPCYQFGINTFSTIISKFADDPDAVFTWKIVPNPSDANFGLSFYTFNNQDGSHIWQQVNTDYTVVSHILASSSTREAAINSSLIFDTPGRKLFSLAVTDRFGVARSTDHVVDVKENSLTATLSKPTYTVELGSGLPACIDVAAAVSANVSSPVIKVTYKVLSGGSGTMTATSIGVMKPNVATVFKKLSDIWRFDFLPTAVGRHEIEIKIELSDGRVATVRPIVDVAYPAVALTVSGDRRPMPQGDSREVTVTAAQKQHDTPLQWRYKFVKGTGAMVRKSDNLTLTPNKDYSIANSAATASPAALQFTSTNTGDVEVLFTATGIDGSVATSTYAFEVYSTSTVVSFPNAPSTVDLFGKLSGVMNIDRPYYTDDFTVTYTLLIGNPTYTGRGTLSFASGSKFKTGGTDFVFTPSNPGRTQYTFTITDKFGEKATKTLVFEVIPPELKFSMSVPAHTAAKPNGGTSSFTFTVTEQNHTDEFWFEFGFGKPDGWTINFHEFYLDGVKIDPKNSYSLAPGTHTFMEKKLNVAVATTPPNPKLYSTLQDELLILKVTDKYAQTKSISEKIIPTAN